MAAPYPANLWPSAAATQRIIKASIPCPNHQRLREQLHNFHVDFLFEAPSAKGWKLGRDKRAKQIANAAEMLIGVFATPKDGLLHYYLWRQLDLDRETLVAALAQLKRAAENLPSPSKGNTGGLKNWTAVTLESVYRQCFERSDRYTRDSLGVNSACVSFIKAAAAEIKLDGKPFDISGETIAKALAASHAGVGKAQITQE